METCCKIDEKPTFDLIWALFGVKKDPKMWPLGDHILHISKSSSIKPNKEVAFEFSGNGNSENDNKNPLKIQFLPIFYH